MSWVYAFLYGWAAGITAVILGVLYGFDTIVKLLRALSRFVSFLRVLTSSGDAAAAAAAANQNQTARESSLRDLGLEGVDGGSKGVTPSVPIKLSSPCLISWYTSEIDTNGPPVECRITLVDRVVTVYEVLPSRNDAAGAAGAAGAVGVASGTAMDGGSGAFTGAAATSRGGGPSATEHLKGRFSITRIYAYIRKPNPKEKKQVGNPFAGRALVITTTDGEPLLTGGEFGLPVRGSVTGLVSEQSDGLLSPGTFAGPSGIFGSQANLSSLEQGGLRTSASVGTLNALNGEVVGGGGGSSNVNSAEVRSMGSVSMSRRRSTSPGRLRRVAVGMPTWCTVIIKFSSLRETERWMNILHGLEEAEAWRDFAKTVPNPNTANLFLSRFFFQNMRLRGGLEPLLRKMIQKQLRKVAITKFPRDMGGQILLDDFVIGTKIPWITEVSEPTVSTSGEMGFDFNLHYKGGEGGFTLFFRLALTYRGIRIPHVTVSLKLHELEATVHVSIGSPPSKKFWIAGHKPPVLRIEVHQGCASGKGLLHRILTALPDLSNIITNLLKMYLISDMVLPYMDDFPLPSVEKDAKISLADYAKVRTFDRRRAAEKSAAPVDVDGPGVFSWRSPKHPTTPPAGDAASAAGGSSLGAAKPNSPSPGAEGAVGSNGGIATPSAAGTPVSTSVRGAGTAVGGTANDSATAASTPHHQRSMQGSGSGGAVTTTHPLAPNGTTSSEYVAAPLQLEPTLNLIPASAPAGHPVSEAEPGSLSEGASGRPSGGSFASGTTQVTNEHRENRNLKALKKLLKIKGSDMTRGSVARTKVPKAVQKGEF